MKEATAPAAAPPLSVFLYRLTRDPVRLLLKITHRLECLNVENIPKYGGAILVANHASFLDIPVVACTSQRPIHFVGRDSLARVPILGPYLKRTGVLFIKRGTADLVTLRMMTDLAASGRLVAIYPEGTRSHDGFLQNFRAGVLIAARRARVPLIPVGILGTFDAYSRHRKFPKLTGRLIASYGAPVEVRAGDGPEMLETLISRELERAADRFEERTGRPWPYREKNRPRSRSKGA